MSEDNVLNAKVQIDKDTVVFAMKDMDFLKDEAKTESEIAAAQEELDNINHKIEKIEDRRKVVFGDYCYAINNKMQRFEKHQMIYAGSQRICRRAGKIMKS